LKKVTFKLFFYITLVIVILELGITYLNTRDRNEIYIREMQERLKYNSSILGAKLESSMKTVEILAGNFSAGINNREENLTKEQIKINADREMQKFMTSSDITGGYYLLNVNGEEISNSFYIASKNGKIPVGNLPERDIQEFRNIIENSRLQSGWAMPLYIKDMNANTAVYFMNIDNGENISGVLILTLDYGKLEEMLASDEADGEYYLINPQNEIFITNNQDINVKNINIVENSTLLSMIKNIHSSDRKTGLVTPAHIKREFYSFYKLDDKNIFILKKNASVLQSVEFVVDNIWMIIVFNIAGIALIYYILKTVLGRPVSQLNKALYAISEKDLSGTDFGVNKFYLLESYNKLLKTYKDFVNEVKDNSMDIKKSNSLLFEKTSMLLNKNLKKESDMLKITGVLQRNQENFDKVYNLMMENHKMNTAIQNEFSDINRNIKLLRENFEKERENGDLTEKLINEINKISFQINVFGLNSTIEMYSGSGSNSVELEESSKEIRHLANRIKLLSEEIKTILKQERISFQLKNKSLNLIADYIAAFTERFTGLKKNHEREIVRYVENKDSMLVSSSNLEELRNEIIRNRDVYSKEIYEIKKLEENLKKLIKLTDEYKLDSEKIPDGNEAD
jgi:methyl-accepting chemotaxis protein